MFTMFADTVLSIIIVNWNTRELLAQCLESVRRDLDHTPDAGPSSSTLAAEVIVVDNASSDGSAEAVREHFPWVHLVQNVHNMGFARANNQGLQAAVGRHLLLLNSDTVVHPGALSTLVKFIDAHPGAGACGARLLNADGSLQHACHPMLTPEREFWRLLFLERIWPQATYPMADWSTEVACPVDAIKGACLLLRRTALDQIGLLDEEYFMYTEEVDLCRRLNLGGWELWYVPQAVVTHYGGASSSQMADAMYLQLYRSKLQFYRKFGGEPAAHRARLLFSTAYAGRWAVATVGSLVKPAYRGQAKLYRMLLAELPAM